MSSNEKDIIPKYIMATILMPIQVNHLEEDDFICLQEYAKISLDFCKELPIIKEGEGYGNLSEKINQLYENYAKMKIEDEKGEGIIEKGVIDLMDEKKEGMENKIEKKKRVVKHNITYRTFRENQKSHRYTFRNLS